MTVRLELRAMAPPEPMTRILEALGTLGADDSLEATLPHEPRPLYPMLEQRGFSHEVLSEEPGACVVRIRRAK